MTTVSAKPKANTGLPPKAMAKQVGVGKSAADMTNDETGNGGATAKNPLQIPTVIRYNSAAAKNFECVGAFENGVGRISAAQAADPNYIPSQDLVWGWAVLNKQTGFTQYVRAIQIDGTPREEEVGTACFKTMTRTRELGLLKTYDFSNGEQLHTVELLKQVVETYGNRLPLVGPYANYLLNCGFISDHLLYHLFDGDVQKIQDMLARPQVAKLLLGETGPYVPRQVLLKFPNAAVENDIVEDVQDVVKPVVSESVPADTTHDSEVPVPITKSKKAAVKKGTGGKRAKATPAPPPPQEPAQPEDEDDVPPEVVAATNTVMDVSDKPPMVPIQMIAQLNGQASLAASTTLNQCNSPTVFASEGNVFVQSVEKVSRKKQATPKASNVSTTPTVPPQAPQETVFKKPEVPVKKTKDANPVVKNSTPSKPVLEPSKRKEVDSESKENAPKKVRISAEQATTIETSDANPITNGASEMVLISDPSKLPVVMTYNKVMPNFASFKRQNAVQKRQKELESLFGTETTFFELLKQSDSDPEKCRVLSILMQYLIYDRMVKDNRPIPKFTALSYEDVVSWVLDNSESIPSRDLWQKFVGFTNTPLDVMYIACMDFYTWMMQAHFVPIFANSEIPTGSSKEELISLNQHAVEVLAVGLWYHEQRSSLEYNYMVLHNPEAAIVTQNNPAADVEEEVEEEDEDIW